MANRELQILLSAKDMASGPIKGVSGELRGIGTSARQGVATASQNLTRLGVIAGGFLVANIALGIRSLAELESVTAATNAVIESTGGIAGMTAKDIRDMSEEMENLTTIDDKVIQGGANLLLTFTNVRRDAFEPAMEAALDMSVALGQDLNGSVTMLGKALNDPIRGITALRRVGVTFTAAQEEQIRTLVDQNDLLGAQKVILDELAVEFGGAAEAQAGTIEGQWARVKDSIEGAQMALAQAFLPLLERGATELNERLGDPATLARIEGFGESLAGYLERGIDAIDDFDWTAVSSALQLGGQGAKAAYDIFMSMPPWVQTAVLTGWGLNKLTGGAVSTIVGQLGAGLVKGVLGMTAGVVNIKAGVVNGGGGIGGPRGGIPGTAVGTGALGAAAMTFAITQSMTGSESTDIQDIRIREDFSPAQADTLLQLREVSRRIDELRAFDLFASDEQRAAEATELATLEAEAERLRGKLDDLKTGQIDTINTASGSITRAQYESALGAAKMNEVVINRGVGLTVGAQTGASALISTATATGAQRIRDSILPNTAMIAGVQTKVEHLKPILTGIKGSSGGALGVLGAISGNTGKTIGTLASHSGKLDVIASKKTSMSVNVPVTNNTTVNVSSSSILSSIVDVQQSTATGKGDWA